MEPSPPSCECDFPIQASAPNVLHCVLYLCFLYNWVFLSEGFNTMIHLKYTSEEGSHHKKGKQNPLIFCYCICINLNILLKQFICEDEPPLSSNKDICEYHIGFPVASATLVVKKLWCKKLVKELWAVFVLFSLCCILHIYSTCCVLHLLIRHMHGRKVTSVIDWGIKSSSSMCPFCFWTASEAFVATDANH